ncbi:polysaccharide deacetylase family protein [Paenibacillus rigui]|uniref:Polysaccharide deacetylase n=1 Tax=Paenibacillus rigui TaxID=554312 RepID=A0A229UR10_9BACL|nr:polysaccharide deacetylase family protein [Paenibacillus rigui]OXM85830.1 polysaccharide deacetylase [Paenibacillus rigui]
MRYCWSGITITVSVLALLLLPTSSAAAPKKDRNYYESRGEVVWEVPTEEKIIALTFDDGPHPEHTALILDLLKQYDAKATFFVVGNKVERFPELLKREVAEGHELANHTYSHAYLSRKMNIKKEIDQTEELVYSITGQKCHLFRPPGGIFNERLISVAKEEGYKVVMWSWHQDTKDWRTPGVGKITDRVLNHTKNGDIVLFHDYIEGPTQTVEALKRILPELKKRGYRFVTISELLTYSKVNPVKK